MRRGIVKPAEGKKQGGTTGLISAVPLEGSVFMSRLRPAAGAPATSGLPSIYSGMLSGKKAVYLSSGVGAANAAHAATLLICRHAPDLIINLGVGGAYPSSGLKVGDVAIATREIYADTGVALRDGLMTLEAAGLPLLRRGRRKWFNEFPLGYRHTRGLIRHLIRTSFNPRLFEIRTGAFATVSACTGTGKRAREIEQRFDVICENMEGAAIAHICAIHQIPMIEIRGISNLVEDRDRDGWDLEGAAGRCQQVVLQLLEGLKES